MHKQKHMETTNPYLVKKIVTVFKEVEEEVDVIDWNLVPSGTYMTGKIDGTEAKGVLYKDDTDIDNIQLYLCQNVKNGAKAPFKFGFDYSWVFTQRLDGTYDANVSDIQFPPKPHDLVIPPIPPLPPKPLTLQVGTYQSEIYVDHIIVGCQTISKENILEVLAKMEELSKSIEETK